MLSKTELESQMEALGPWHHRIHIRDDIFTGSSAQKDATGQVVQSLQPERSLGLATKSILPNGLENRSFLDCACNAGGYSFAAKDRGAGRVFGFDVRDHWINQAKFVQTHRSANSSGISFEKCDLMDLKTLDEPFDITWFSGIFYHLADPVAGLKLAADQTKELLFLNTACLPHTEQEEPHLKLKLEGTEQLMSGVCRLSWMPSGPKVLMEILKWLGFAETKIYFWNSRTVSSVNHQPVAERIGIVAAREKGRLEAMKGMLKPIHVSN